MADNEFNNPLASDIASIVNATQSPLGTAKLNLARQRENDIATGNVILQDRQALSPLDFSNKYGPAVTQQVDQLDLSVSGLQNMISTPRSGTERATDALSNVGIGLMNSVGGAGVLAARTLGAAPAQALAEIVDKDVKYFQSKQSDAQQNARTIVGLSSELDRDDNESQYKKDVDENGQLAAELRSFGRGATDAAVRLYENPMMLESGIAEGVGSVLAAAPVGGVVNKLAEVGKKIIGGSAVAEATGVSIPVAIGLMEGGSTYSQVSNEVMGMSHEDLSKNSPYYLGLIAQGATPEEAKSLIADRAGVRSASIQGPIAALTGKLVAGFEGAPLARTTMATSIKDILKEGLEEGTQSFTGELSQNIGIQDFADQTRRLGENLGASATEGAILGLGSAGAIKAPSIATNPVSTAVKTGRDYLVERGKAAQEAREAASTVSVDNVRQDIDDARVSAPAVVEGLREIAATVPANQQPEAADYISRVGNAVNISRDELSKLTPTQVERINSDYNGNNPDRFETIVSMAKLAGDSKQSPAERAAAGLFITQQIDNAAKLFESLPEFLLDQMQDDPRFVAFDQYAQKLSKIVSIKEVRQAMEMAAKPELVADVDITKDNVATPEVQQTINNAVVQAEKFPQNVDAKLADKILRQSDDGNITLTEAEKASLKASMALTRSGKVYSDELGEDLTQEDAKTGNVRPDRISPIVGSQIEVDGGIQPWQKSMVQHVQDINAAVRSGNIKEATTNMTALNMFAQSMANKVAALNASAQGGKGEKVKYVSSGPGNRWLPVDKRYTATVHLGNERSVEFAKQVTAEAKALVTLANNMATIFPEYGVQEIAIPELILPEVQTEAPVKEEATVEAKPEPVVETPTVEPVANPEPSVAEITPEVIADEKIEQEGKAERRASEKQAQVLADEIVEQEGKKARRAQERAVEPTVEPVEEPKTIQTTYPNLVSSNEDLGRNQFYVAYKLPKEERSRINRLENPVKDIRSLITSPFAMVEFMDGKDINYDITDDNLDALEDMLSTAKEIYEVMDYNLFRSEKGRDLINELEAGRPANRYKRGRMLNIVETTPKGYRYNKTLVQAAIIAGINEAMNSQQKKANIARQDAADIMGVAVDQINQSDVDMLEQGQSVSDFRRSLATKIMEYWGVTGNNNVSDTQVIGIAEGVASEVMIGLVEAGLISESVAKRTFSVNGNVQFFTQNRINFDNRSEDLVNTINKLGSAGRLLDSLLLVQPSEELGLHIGSPSGNVPKTQLRSPNVENTMQQREALAAEANTPYLPNTAMHSFMKNMGVNNFIKFMGGREFKKGELNINHEKSVEGKNRTLRYSYDSVMNHFNELAAFAEKAGIALEEMATYFDHNMSKVGRMQMQGANNPQSDKLWRELIMATKSTLDMTDNAQADMFWMTVAQGIGVKTEKVTRAVAVQDAKDQMTTTYKDIIPQLVTWLGTKEDLPANLVDDIIKAMGSKASMHGLHGLMSVAQYEKAKQDNADLTKYEHFNYLEADGKTNGPIMTVALFAPEISGDIIKVLRKGGISIGEMDRSLNSHILERDGQDLYQSTTISTAKFQDEFRETIKDDPKAMRKLNSLQRVMAALDSNISLKTDESGNPQLVLERGVTKNPLTISIYGSGIDGIAGNVTNALLEVIYEKFSELNNSTSTNKDIDLGDMITNKDGSPYGAKQFENDLLELIEEGSRIDAKTKEIVYFKPRGSDQGGRSGNPADFTFSPKQFNALQSNVRTFFVNQMHKGIQEQILDHVSESTNALQVATQLQSIFLTGGYQQGYIDTTLDNREADDYYQGDVPSKNQQNQIHKNLLPLSPLIKTGTQNFFISGSTKSDLGESYTLDQIDPKTGKPIKITFPDTFASSVDDRMRGPAFMYRPDVAGVKGVPSLVIGTGDGMIMQTASTMKGAPKGTTKVFDGINLPATDIDGSSRKVNEAVYIAMTANPMAAVAESFDTFMSNDPVGLLNSDDVIIEVKDFIRREVTNTWQGYRLNPKNKDGSLKTPDQLREEYLPDGEIQNYLAGHARILNRLAVRLEARNKAFAEVSMSVDQMASAEAPYSKEGTLATSADPDVMADIFRARQDEIYNELIAKAEGTPAIERDNAQMMTALEDTTTPDESGARIATIPSLRIWLDNAAKGLSVDQRSMLSSALEALKDTGYQVLFGSKDQLNQYEGLNNPEYYSDLPYLGKIIPDIKRIFIQNVTGETLLHELVHAATLDKVIGYYTNPAALSVQDRDAVKRIEGLMNEWLTQATDVDSEQLNTARLMATNAIGGYLRSNQPALALNEFMAWVLANQELIKSQKKVAVKNPLLKIIGDTLTALKELVWGGRKAPAVSDDLYSNLRFNTRILMKTPTPTELAQTDIRKASMYQSIAFGSSDRLLNLRTKLVAKVSEFVNADEVLQRSRELDKERARARAERVLNGRVAGAFNMTQQEASTFEIIHTALALQTDLDPNALARMQDIYAYVLDNLTVESLMADPNSPNQGLRTIAQDQFDIITGAYRATFDGQGRSDRLSTFLAVAMVNDNFRNYLSNLKPPKKVKDETGTLDAALDNIGNAALDRLTQYFAGDSGSKNVREAMDNLSNVLIERSADDTLFMEQYTVQGLDKADSFIKDNINNLSDKVLNYANRTLANATNPIGRGLLRLVRIGATVANEQASTEAVKGITSFLNQKENLNTIREFVAEIVGRTKENSSVFDMISSVRAAVQQTRQQFREKLPEQLLSKFERTLSDVEKTDLFYGLAKTDAAGLFDRFGVQGTLELIKDNARLNAQINSAEVSVRALAPTRARTLIQKARQLANYMNTGDHGSNLLRNAHAVAHLFGEVGQARTVDAELIKTIDALVSMYALESLDGRTKASLADLANNENTGMDYLLSYLVGTRADENSNITGDISRNNNYKGYVPSLNQIGTNLQVANDAAGIELINLGYVRVGDYNGSSVDRRNGTYGYYFAPVSGRATYNQGVLQTVHQTVNGIQPNTGYTIENTAGRITDPKKVQNIRRSLANQRNTTENLLPVYNDKGQVIAYERAMDPGMLGYLNKNTNLFEMTGVWRGRQVEEKLAQVYNEQLIDNLSDIWDEGKKNRETNQFVDLSQSDDPIHMDTWNLIPNDIKDVIKSKFGRAGFPIRRDMINDAVGFRSASIGDFWTGNTRASDGTAETVRNIADGIFDMAGSLNPKLRKSAFASLVQLEKSFQNLITEAKVLIVVKSVVVPFANAVANIYQLMHRGVPLRLIAKGMASKTAETRTYITNRAKEIELDADLKAAIGANNNVAIRKLNNQIQAIQDSYRRLSIWPLLEAGEFSAITEGGVSNDDLKLSTLIDRVTSKLPDALQTPYRYGVITKDTALFKGLAQAVQYSDFLAKAVLFDDLKRKGMTDSEALAAISEEFINYNRLAGRVRNYAESTGLIWFWNFKLRSMKVAVSMIRNNPARSLLMSFMPPVVPFLGNVGTPLSDNMLSVLADGRLGFSIGPSLGLRAPSMNPWYALFR